MVKPKKDSQDGKEKKDLERLRALKGLQSRVDRIRASDDSITKSQRMCTAEAIKAGEELLAARDELKASKAMGFVRWIEEICKIPYKRAYNYFTLAEAVKNDASIRQMGLTEAYIHLHLVTRRSKDQTPTSDNVASNGDKSDTNTPTALHVANIEVLRERDVYVLEVQEQNFLDTLQAVIADSQNLTKILKGGGLLIKLASITDDVKTEATAPAGNTEGGDNASSSK